MCRDVAPPCAADWLLAGGDVVQALSALPLSRVGGGTRPQWVGGMALLQAVACALLALPHTTHWAAAGGGQLANATRSLVETQLLMADGVNATLCGQTPSVAVEHPCYITVTLLAILQLARGLGGASSLVHGLVYLDDNVVSEAAPALIGAVLAVQQLGFRLGHALAYLSTGGAEDPINGWWIGWTVLSVLLCVCGLLLVMFPARLPAAAVRDRVDHILSEASAAARTSPPGGARVQISNKRYVIREPPDTSFCPSLGRVFSNAVALCKMLAILFAVAAFLNMEGFRDKYLESIYHIPLPKDLLQDPWLSRITTSLLEPVVCALVVSCAGLVVSWRQPGARCLSGWVCAALTGCAVLSLSQLWLGCHQLSVSGERDGAPAEFLQPCNSACRCSRDADFAPVCSVTTRHTYYSACLAGCTEIGAYTGFLKTCSCISGGGFAQLGSCDYEQCSSRWVVLQVLWVLAAVLRSTTYVASVLIVLRCLEPEDKAIGLGSLNTVVGLLALLPISFGFRALVDSHCEFWDEAEYSCKLYHSRGLELSVTFFVFALLLCSSVMDAVVCVLVRRVRIYPDMEAEETESGAGGGGSELSASQRQKLLRRRATPLPRRRRDAPEVQLRRRAATGAEDEDDDDSDDGDDEVQELRAVQSLMARGNGQPGLATTAF
ncbi:solute carrier organic anion transporter family member 74D-like [Schistocerca piceifrons]|uniref:solute carrier organic anion transporter family member 74D-like n=1 Tax=Schistocerca piceifrons TaxID=274613 RepID=UPI001F5FE878|nr:solute carrier organic anion transporter family member 74D-like [Schistocerca piceifrons]